MSKTHPPELKKYMDKRMNLKMNGGRAVTGVLRGFDPFMNLVITTDNHLTSLYLLTGLRLRVLGLYPRFGSKYKAFRLARFDFNSNSWPVAERHYSEQDVPRLSIIDSFCSNALDLFWDGEKLD